MAPVFVDPSRTHVFESAAAFEKWLSKHHASETEVWIKIHKKGSGLPSITPAEAIDVCLCWGWIDAIRKSFDETSFVQRYTPRGRKSVWSQINVDNVARLTAAGRMTPHGQAHVDAAKADGRWARAYMMRTSTTPADLMKAIEASPRALATYRTLDRANLFALAFRVENLKTPAGRAAKIASYVAMLARGETLHPLKKAKAKAKAAPKAKPKPKAAPKAKPKPKATRG